ncbi:hypothetical protein GR157_31225 [Burkholderia sp. 4701]|nr:hypothetical protein [Burkholderia sp. 4701]MXN86358.1 hypothetical protein [Burkholderia sp. 4812]
MRSPATAQAGPDAAPRVEKQASAAPAAPLPVPPVVAVRRAHAAPAVGAVHARVADARRAHPQPRAHAAASTKKHVTVTSRPRASDVGAAYTQTHTQTTRVTHQELDGARALARARACAQRDDWGCVEQNASRALAIDPQNSESRALLERAVRNRS